MLFFSTIDSDRIATIERGTSSITTERKKIERKKMMMCEKHPEGSIVIK
ncbi:hypothetical protein ACT4_014_00260 [Acinetobacter sp. NBRC 100985]|nr:hypothetical protein ACT4_014_00260 [Acinetobacter sp. NBRC 100985]